MQIVTLTTDLGGTDHYSAALKGAILRHLPEAQLIDVTHQVRAFDIAQASYFIKNCFADFPEGTIHLIGVDCEPVINFGAPQFSSIPAILKFQNHFFVSNDNGIFSLITDQQEHQGIWHVEEALSKPGIFHFPIKNLLVPIIAKLAKGINPDEFAERKDQFNKKFTVQPTLEPNLILGTIVHVDHFGNLITNIDLTTFERYGKDVPFTIFFRKKEYFIDSLANTYSEVPPGEKLAFFNSNGFLEIAVNRGTTSQFTGANSLFGMSIGDLIRIEFSPKGSKDTLESLF